MAGRESLCPGCGSCFLVPDEAKQVAKKSPERGKCQPAWLVAGLGLPTLLVLVLWLYLQRPGQQADAEWTPQYPDVKSQQKAWGGSAAHRARPIQIASESALWQAFRTNGAAANLRFTGTRVEFLLRSAQISLAAVGKYRISASVNARAERYDKPNIVCYLRADENGKVARFSSDVAWRLRAYKICGVCQGGKPSVGAYGGYCVILDDCAVEGPFEWSRIQNRWALVR
jgi:hypothetical protein